MAETLELHKRIAVLEAQLDLERSQHEQAQQSILYLVRQLIRKHKHQQTQQEDLLVDDELCLKFPLTPPLTPDPVSCSPSPVRTKGRGRFTYASNLGPKISPFLPAVEQQVVPLGPQGSEWVAKTQPVNIMIDDLIQFADDSDKAEEFQEAVTELDPVAKRKHQEMLLKNQALVMYKPSTAEAKSSSTVLVTDIPDGWTLSKILDLVYGGIIISVKAVQTRPLTSTDTVTITFIHAKAAKNFAKSVEEYRNPQVRLLESPTWPLPHRIFQGVIHGNVTRCLAIYGLDREITTKAVCSILAEPGTLGHHSIIRAEKDRFGAMYLEFASIMATLTAQERMSEHQWFKRVKIEYETDLCDRPIEQFTKGKDEDVKEGKGESYEDSTVGVEGSEEGEILCRKIEEERGSKMENFERRFKEIGYPTGGLNYDG